MNQAPNSGISSSNGHYFWSTADLNTSTSFTFTERNSCSRNKRIFEFIRLANVTIFQTYRYCMLKLSIVFRKATLSELKKRFNDEIKIREQTKDFEINNQQTNSKKRHKFSNILSLIALQNIQKEENIYKYLHRSSRSKLLFHTRMTVLIILKCQSGESK